MRTNLRRIRGQGMTEYIIIVALIAIAAIGIYTIFGNVLRDQMGVMTEELAGQDGGTADAPDTTTAAGTKGLDDFSSVSDAP